jgi:hypothetical protein
MNTRQNTTVVNYSKGIYHTINRNDKSVNCIIKISLDDDCKNGHHDFSMTATFWEVGKVRNDRNMITGGCCHDTILKHFPELQIFADLHLSDFKGVPMYAAENGHYHLKNESKETFLSYYPEITAQDYEALSTAINSADYCLKLVELGLFERWETKAKQAIELLEKMSGQTVSGLLFGSDPIQPEKVEDFKKKVAEGYYTPEAISARIEAERNAKFQKIEDERTKDIAKVNTECDAKRAVLLGGLPLDNFIFYNHTKTGSFNWKNYDKKITQEQFEAFVNSEHAKIDGVKWEISKKGN